MQPGHTCIHRKLSILGLAGLLIVACAPAAPASPAAQIAKPAATTAPQKPTAKPEQPAAKPAAKPTEKPAARKAAFDEQAVADFYKGKTVRIVVGFSAGGAIDTAARMVAKYLPQYIPGSPNVIVENKPGAGGLVAINTVYSSEPKDGTVIVAPSQGLLLQQLIGAEGVQFDAAKINWLGSATKSPSACLVRIDTGVKNIQQVIDGKEVVIGAVGPGSSTYEVPMVLKAALGANFKVVTGYGSLSKARVALDGEEIEGFCGFFDAFTSIDRHRLEGANPVARVLIIMGNKTPDHPFLQGVPAAETLAKTDEARQLLRAAAAPDGMSRPLGVAPEVPTERVAALRQALARTYADPQYVADVQKSGATVDPSTGAEVQQTVEEVLSLPQPLRAKLKEILK